MESLQQINSSEVSYIYGLSSSGDNLIRYIGYSSNPLERLKKHIYESKQLKYKRHKWINSELKNGNDILLTTLRCIDTKKISKSEIETILLYKSFGADLVNGNNGGFGGVSPTKEVREKLKISKLGNTWNIGRKPSLKNKEAIDKNNRKPKSEITKERISKANKGKISKRRVFSEEDIVKIYCMYNKGVKIKNIVEELKSNKSTISNVLYSSGYKEVIEKFNLKKKNNKKKPK